MINFDSILSKWEQLDLLERYDKTISLSEAIKYSNKAELDIEKIQLVLNNIESLRFGLGHNKALESISGRLDRALAIAALTIAQKLFTGSELKKYIDSVNYYEDEVQIKMIYDRLLR